MKLYKKFFAALAAFILCFSLAGSAFATELSAEIPEENPEAELPAESTSDTKRDFEGKSWDEIMDEVLTRNGATRDQVAVAYVNLVTGDEYFINPDVYMVAASMYKLPLNMYFTEIINSGEYDWGATYPFAYETVRDDSLIDSDNNQSMFLYDILGGYERFRELTSEYMGSNYADISPDDIFYNRYTAREFANCLKTLYNESERFPGIIETMQKAEPDRFFKLLEPRFKIAHKYGYYKDNGRSHMNDCGIAYTTEPIALVMFTLNVTEHENLLTDYCTTMCEYTEYLANKPEPTPVPAPIPDLEPTSYIEDEPVTEEKAFPIVAVAAVAIFLVLSIYLVIVLCAKYRLRFIWLFLSILVSAAAMLLSILGMHFGTVYAKPSGDPAENARLFADALCSGNFDSAYDLLRDYSDLGLEAEPQTKAAQLAAQALHQSFSYELIGECRIDKLEAKQPIRFTYLDLTALESAIVVETPNQLKRVVEKLPMNQVYDQNKNYLPQVTEQAYINAVSEVLKNAESYYRSIDFELALSYSDGKWQVLASPALLKALNGGTGY